MTITKTNTSSNLLRLPDDMLYCICEYVADQPQMQRVSKEFKEKFTFWEHLAKQYQNLRSIHVSSIIGLFPCMRDVRAIFTSIINGAKSDQRLTQSNILALKENESLISPSRLQRIEDSKAASDTITLFEKIAEQVDEAYTFLTNRPEAESLIERAEALRTWIKDHEAAVQSITHLDMSNCGLTSVPEEIKYLRNLQVLNISDNQLTAFNIPNTLLALQELDVSDNQLAAINIPDALRALQTLNVSFNQLLELNIPATLIRLRRLSASHNLLAAFNIPDALRALQSIDVSDNQLPELNIPATLVALIRLYASNNLLAALNIPGSLVNLKVANI